MDLFSDARETDRAYDGIPLSTLSASKRGRVLEDVARRYEETTGPTILPAPVRNYNGRFLSPQRSYDWERADSTRVEAKSAKLAYLPTHQLWALRFNGVRRNAFDQCVLVCYTPLGLYFGEWDGRTRYSKKGRCTEAVGGLITVAGPRGADWTSALDCIIHRRFPGVVRAFMPWP